MDFLAQLDIFLRGGATAVLLVIAVIFGLRKPVSRKSLSVSALAVGTVAYVLLSSPNLQMSRGWVGYPLVMLAGIAPVLVYWAGVELFVDRFVFRWWHIAVATAIALGAWLYRIIPWEADVRGVLVVLVYLHLIYVAINTSPDDLVEGRRRFRRWFITVMAMLGGTIGIFELFDLDRDLPAFLFPLHAAAFVLLSVVFLFWALAIRDDIWAVRSETEPEAREEILSPAETAVLARLREAMDTGIWQTEGLTVGRLAAELDTPEHRLRRVINRALGYRNFAAFINERRIASATAALSDIKRADTPILTIAHEVGFASLGPFNRAFREATGESPSEYRRRHSRAAD